MFRCRFRKDHREPTIFAGRHRKRSPDLAAVREGFLFAQEHPMRVRVWFHHVLDHELGTGRDTRSRMAQDHLFAGGRVDFPECPSSALRVRTDASRRDRRMAHRKAANNGKPCEPPLYRKPDHYSVKKQIALTVFTENKKPRT